MTAMARNRVRNVDNEACGLFTPGHQVHFIQATRAWEGDPDKYRHGWVVSVDDDGWITVDVYGELLRFWNHDPARARECFAASAGCVGLPGWGLLFAPHKKGQRYCICVTTDGPSPCVPPSTSDLAELATRVKTYGGFVMPGTAILEDQRRRVRGRE